MTQWLSTDDLRNKLLHDILKQQKETHVVFNDMMKALTIVNDQLYNMRREQEEYKEEEYEQEEYEEEEYVEENLVHAGTSSSYYDGGYYSGSVDPKAANRTSYACLSLLTVCLACSSAACAFAGVGT